MNEDELIDAVIDGDPAAERELYDRHIEHVFVLALRMCGDREHASVLAQDTFVQVFEKLHQFRRESKLSTWIHRVTVTTVLIDRRTRARRDRREVGIEAVEAQLSTPPPRVGAIGLKERLHEAILRLPEIYRMVVVLHDLEGYSHQEVGDRLNIAASSSRARLTRARAMLREALGPLQEVIEG